MKMKLFQAVLLALASTQALANSFERDVGEIQVYGDRVRIYIGVTYGTSCGIADLWWGWSTSDARHKDWLALALTAKAEGEKLVFHDAQDACSGPSSDTLGIEGLFMK
jgi:hypothetical protein